MKIRTQLKAGRINLRGENHNEALAVRTALKAGRMRLDLRDNHNEAMQVRTALKAGGKSPNHNEALQTRTGLKAGKKGMRRAVLTTVRKEDRLELMVVRAGLRAGRAVRRPLS